MSTPASAGVDATNGGGDRIYGVIQKKYFSYLGNRGYGLIAQLFTLPKRNYSALIWCEAEFIMLG